MPTGGIESGAVSGGKLVFITQKYFNRIINSITNRLQADNLVFPSVKSQEQTPHLLGSTLKPSRSFIFGAEASAS